MINAASPCSRAALLACMIAATACSSGDGTSSTSGGGGASSSSSAASSSSQSTSAGGVTSAVSSTGASTGTSAGTGTSTSTSGTGGAPNTAAGTIVPLYSNPSDAPWTAIVAAKQAHPSVTVRAIINPNSGPGDSKDPAYATGIAALDAAGIIVLAYVATTYAKKAPAAAQMEIDAYKTWYPGLKGIFFDEMSNKAGDEPYYQGLDYHAKGTGYAVTVGNPGAAIPASFVGTVDTILIYESEGLPVVSSLDAFSGAYAPKNFGVIPYGVPALDAAFVTAARAHVGFIYLTNDGLPNPWDALPPYFSDLLGALE
jgi:hypothetical protein